MPTIGIDIQTVTYGNLKLNALDFGGRGKIRALWHQHYKNTTALVFVVDSNDHERLSDACEELHRMANKDELKNRPILIFANKRDLPNAQSLDVIKEGLKLSKLDEMKTKWHLQSAVATKNEGIKEGFEWLANTVRTKVDLVQPIIETINDSKIIKANLSSLWNSINPKTLLSKFI
jgi:ADP-ribosylation factor protein 1